MLDLLDWDDLPAPVPAQRRREQRSSSPASASHRAFARPRTASLASTTFSMLTEHDQEHGGDPGKAAVGESDGELEGEVATSDADDHGTSSCASDSDDNLPELSFSSASERGSPSPSPPTPDPLDIDSLDEPLFAFSRSPTPVEKNSQTQALAWSAADTRAASLATGPTQAQMDAFFGFVDPYAGMRASGEVREPEREGTQAEHAREMGAGALVGAEEGDELDETADGAPAAATPAEGKEPEEDKPLAAAKDGKRYFQLAPLSKVSSETGLPLSAEERRLAIIDSLERLALSIVEQIVDSVTPEPRDAVSQSAKRPTPGWQKVTVVLAKRDGKNGGPGPDNPATTTTQAIKFPRRYGHGGNLRLGGRELACLLKVIEFILDGLKTGVVCTKRDLYYRDVGLFVKQYIVDSLIDDIAATLQVRRSELNVVATAKGLLAGAVKLVLLDGSELAGGEQARRGALIPAGQAIDRLELDDPKWVLVIEKDAVFHSLAASSLLNDAELGNGILLTGKGYPDLATRELLKRLSDALPSVPIFALVDSDPHGLSILSVYACGSYSQAHDAANLVVPRVQWLGVKGSEWDVLGVGRDELLPLAKADRAKALAMLRKEGLPCEWRRELEYMLHLNRKAEIQVLSSPSFSSPSAVAVSSGATQVLQHGNAQQQQPSRLVEYVKKALWLALDDADEEMDEDGDA
ncbi:endodeoxyribonuclease [Rhodotorula kratochvilovae]